MKVFIHLCVSSSSTSTGLLKETNRCVTSSLMKGDYLHQFASSLLDLEE